LESLGKLETKLLVVCDVACTIDVRNKVILLNINGEDLTSLVDHNHAVSLGVTGCNDAKLVCELLSEQQTGSGDFVHVEETELCNDEHNAVLGAVLHQYGEVTFLLNLDVGRSFEFLLAWCWVANLHDMQLLGVFAILLLTEAEERILVAGVVADGHISESGGKTL